jgi:hypothetical protein
MQRGLIRYYFETDAKTAYRSDFFNKPVRLSVMEKDYKRAFEILEQYDSAKEE